MLLTKCRSPLTLQLHNIYGSSFPKPLRYQLPIGWPVPCYPSYKKSLVSNRRILDTPVILNTRVQKCDTRFVTPCMGICDNDLWQIGEASFGSWTITFSIMVNTFYLARGFWQVWILFHLIQSSSALLTVL